MALAISLSTPIAAWAILGMGGEDAPQAQQYYIHDEETFKEVAKSFHRIPFNDPKLEFDILLPKDWTAEAATQAESTPDLSRKIQSDIARFKSPIIGTSQASVIVQIIHLEHEISAENWLKNYVSVNGYSLQEKAVAINEKRATVSFVSSFEDKSSYVSALLQVNGNAALIVRFETPLALKETLAFLRKRSLESFKLILPTDDPIEPQKMFSFGEAAKFNYPESWNINYPDFKNPNNMSVQLRNENRNGQLEGLMRFMAVKRGPHTTLQQEIEKLMKYFDKNLGIDFKKMTSSGAASAHPRFIFSRYEAYNVNPRKENASDQEIRFVILGDREWYILIFMLTPSSAENFYTWATNVQTYDLLIKTIK